MMVKNSKLQTVFCAGLIAMLLASCGKKADKETVYVQAPTTAQPVPAVVPVATTPETVLPPTQDKVVSALNVEIKNKSALNAGQSLPKGKVSVEFGPVDQGSSSIQGITYQCKLESTSQQGTALSEACTSPKVLDLTQDGQYTFTVFASQASSGSTGLPAQINLAVGNVQSSGGSGSNGGGVAPVAPVQMQVGDMFHVNIPQGMHMVYRSSTVSGRLIFQTVDGGSSVDDAAPFDAFQCQGRVRSMVGSPVNYCESSPSISFNTQADPFYNTFRWLTQNMVSYNSIMIASDSSLDVGRPIGSNDVRAMQNLSVNVFSNVSGNPNGAGGLFATELSQTSSRLQMSCFGQPIQYLANVAIFQGFFNWDVAAVPLFGCVVPRNGKWFVEIAAMPLDQQLPILPQAGWGTWLAQSFSNVRAAEIMVEMGPFDYAVAPMAIAPDAQQLMLSNLKKVLPSVQSQGNGGFNNGPYVPSFNH